MRVLSMIYSMLFTVALFIFAVWIILLPMFYFDGKAKAKVLKECREVEFAWYEATWMSYDFILEKWYCWQGDE